MFVLGLTGGIAGGKSTVARFFAENGALVADADAVVRAAQQPGHAAFDAMKKAIGETYFNADGTLNRAALRDAVFKTPAILKTLEDIFHPVVHAYYDRLLAEQAPTNNVVVLDVPLLIGGPTQKRCDAVAVALCDDAVRKQRAFARPHMSEEYWQFMTARQPSRAMFEKEADFIIRTDVALEDTKAQVDEIYSKIKEKA